MPINTDFKNLAPNVLNFNRLNLLNVPSNKTPVTNTTVETKPTSRREQIVAQKQSDVASAKIKQGQSQQIYNANFGQTSFVRTDIKTGTTTDIDKTTGLNQQQQHQVATDPKAGPILPNSTLGIDASEQVIADIFKKSLNGSPDLEKELDNVAGDMGQLYRDIAAQRKAASAPKATGALNFRTAANARNAAKGSVNFEDRLQKIDQHLADACKSYTGISGKNFSAMFFLLVMEGIKDAQEFRMDELHMRKLTDKLKLQAKDLVKEKLALNFQMEEGKALADAINSSAQAGCNMVKDMVQIQREQVGKATEKESAENKELDDKLCDVSRDAMLESQTPEDWLQKLSAHGDGVTSAHGTAIREHVQQQKSAWESFLQKKTADDGGATEAATLKQQAWTDFKQEQTAGKTSFAVASEKAGKVDEQKLQWLNEKCGALKEGDGAKKQEYFNAFTAMVGQETAKKLLAGNDQFTELLAQLPHDDINNATQKALTGDLEDLNSWINQQKAAGASTDEIYTKVAHDIGTERAIQLAKNNGVNKDELSGLQKTLHDQFGKIDQPGLDPYLARGQFAAREVPTGTMANTAEQYSDERGILALAQSGYKTGNTKLANITEKEGRPLGAIKQQHVKAKKELKEAEALVAKDEKNIKGVAKEAQAAVASLTGDKAAIQQQLQEKYGLEPAVTDNLFRDGKLQTAAARDFISAKLLEKYNDEKSAHVASKDEAQQAVTAVEQKFTEAMQKVEAAVSQKYDKQIAEIRDGKSDDQLTPEQREKISQLEADKAAALQSQTKMAKMRDLNTAWNVCAQIGGDQYLTQAMGEFLKAATVGTNLVYDVSSHSQQYVDNASVAAQQLARMFAAMKLAFR